MRSAEPVAADWRDAGAYAPILEAERAFIAWEWLRRDENYRTAARQAWEGSTAEGERGEQEQARGWGLHRFEDPALGVPDARPIWRAEAFPHLLSVRAGPPRAGDAFELKRWAALSSINTDECGREHLLLSDGWRGIRIDVISGTLRLGACTLSYQLSGIQSAEAPLLELRQLLALCRTGRFSSSLHPRERRARRWQLLLRTYDALQTGASQREIAAELLTRDVEESGWRVNAPSVRSQVQRLARSARLMGEGRYRRLLRLELERRASDTTDLWKG